uniref:Uncharacterized protein n=1 Tax=Solanum tuberosum TaxID=4113 RepID=M1D8A2_SOLTU
MCCEEPFGAISRDRRVDRRSAVWSIPSPFCFDLQHLQVLKLWVIWLCIAELFGDSPTDFSFRAWHTRTLGETMAVRRLTQWVRRSSSLVFFVLSAALFVFSQYCPCFVPQSKYLKFKDLHQLLAQNMHLRTLNILK